VAEWQTRQTQNLLSERTWEFKSPRPHQPNHYRSRAIAIFATSTPQLSLVFPAGREDSQIGNEPNEVRWRFCHIDQRVGDPVGGYERPPAGKIFSLPAEWQGNPALNTGEPCLPPAGDDTHACGEQEHQRIRLPCFSGENRGKSHPSRPERRKRSYYQAPTAVRGTLPGCHNSGSLTIARRLTPDGAA
jgi:hypothetical protein